MCCTLGEEREKRKCQGGAGLVQFPPCLCKSETVYQATTNQSAGAGARVLFPGMGKGRLTSGRRSNALPSPKMTEHEARHSDMASQEMWRINGIISQTPHSALNLFAALEASENGFMPEEERADRISLR